METPIEGKNIHLDIEGSILKKKTSPLTHEDMMQSHKHVVNRIKKMFLRQANDANLREQYLNKKAYKHCIIKVIILCSGDELPQFSEPKLKRLLEDC